MISEKLPPPREDEEVVSDAEVGGRAKSDAKPPKLSVSTPEDSVRAALGAGLWLEGGEPEALRRSAVGGAMTAGEASAGVEETTPEATEPGVEGAAVPDLREEEPFGFDDEAAAGVLREGVDGNAGILNLRASESPGFSPSG